jgi:hypothetical protein
MKPTKPANVLSKKALNCLATAGIPVDKEAVRKALETKILRPHSYPRNYGKKTHAEVCRWVGTPQGFCPECGAPLHPLT